MFRKKPPVPTLPPEWVVVGLGNPGPEYLGTRHNVGFAVIDILAERGKVKLATRKHRAVYGVGEVRGVQVVLVKPMTYMNLSGQAVNPILREFVLRPDRLIVITDELDLPLGRLKVRPSGSAGGHNGHKSLISSLATQDYARIRIGIGKGTEPGADHVLSKFHPDERKDAEDTLKRAADAAEAIMLDGIEAAMNRFNVRS